MKYAYVCSQYRADTKEELQRNIDHARKVCKSVAALGYVPVAPHLYFPQFLDDNEPEQRKIGLEMALKLLRKCSIVFVVSVPGLDVSEGMHEEIHEATQQGIPVHVMTLDEIQAESCLHSPSQMWLEALNNG